jgi:hypothetical protein
MRRSKSQALCFLLSVLFASSPSASSWQIALLRSATLFNQLQNASPTAAKPDQQITYRVRKYT